MKKADYEKFMKIAINEAKKSIKSGNKGFGAVLIKNGKVVARAFDTDITDNDPTAHAEMHVIKKAAKKYGRDLSGCTIISTHEPCPMCTGAIIWSKISKLVYGASIKDSLKAGRTMIDLTCKDIINKSPYKIKIVSGILKHECSNLYAGT